MVTEAGYAYFKLTDNHAPKCWVNGIDFCSLKDREKTGMFNTDIVLRHPIPLHNYKYGKVLSEIEGKSYSFSKELCKELDYLNEYGFRNWLTHFHNIDVGDIVEVFI